MCSSSCGYLLCDVSNHLVLPFHSIYNIRQVQKNTCTCKTVTSCSYFEVVYTCVHYYFICTEKLVDDLVSDPAFVVSDRRSKVGACEPQRTTYAHITKYIYSPTYSKQLYVSTVGLEMTRHDNKKSTRDVRHSPSGLREDGDSSFSKVKHR